MKAVLISALLASSIAFAAEVTIDLPPGDYVISPVPDGSYVLSVPDTSIPVDPPTDPVDPPTDPVAEVYYESYDLIAWTFGYQGSATDNILNFPNDRSNGRVVVAGLPNVPVVIEAVVTGVIDSDYTFRFTSAGGGTSYCSSVEVVSAGVDLTVECPVTLINGKDARLQITDGLGAPSSLVFKSLKVYQDLNAPTDPVDPVDPPTDPVDPPTDPVDPPVTGSPYDDYEFLASTYMPRISDGPYTDGYCEYSIDPSWTVVRMQPGERLQQVFDRAEPQGKPGVVVEIPYEATGANGYICDSGRMTNNKAPGNLVIKGIPGPNGELPHFQCRNDSRDGNIPKSLKKGTALDIGTPGILVIDSIRHDGYRGIGVSAYSDRVLIKNSYIHHSIGNGLVYSNVYSPGHPNKFVEVCGSEISHNGAGNTEHGIYAHRGTLPEDATPEQVAAFEANPSDVTFVSVDSYWHSNQYSSQIKTIANKNILKNNIVRSQADDDPTFSRHWGSMLIDVAACATNIIEGNTIIHQKPSGTSLGYYSLALRNRAKVVQGCDVPNDKSPSYFDPAVWNAVEHSLITIVRDNDFYSSPVYYGETIPEGVDDFQDRVVAITDWGTWPMEAVTLGLQHWRMPPIDADGNLIWKDQHRVVIEGNRFHGFTEDRLYNATYKGDCSFWSTKCPPPVSITPMDYFGVGPEELPLDAYFDIGVNTFTPPTQ